MTSLDKITRVEYPHLIKDVGVKSMPVYRVFKPEGYEVSVMPVGIRKLFKFFPYFIGSKVNLTLSVKNISNEKRELAYQWILYRWDGEKEHEVLHKAGTLTPNLQGKNGEKIHVDLFIPGVHNLKLRLSQAGQNLLPPWPVIASFQILERDTLVAQIIVGSIAIIAMFIGWVLGKIG